MKIERLRILATKYPETIAKILRLLPHDERNVLVVLCHKGKTFTDSIGDAPVFAFVAGDEVAMRKIVDTAEDIINRNPGIHISGIWFLTATFDNREFTDLITQPAEAADPDIRASIIKLKTEMLGEPIIA